MTERSFNSNDSDGKPLDPAVQNATYSETLISDTADTSLNIGDVVEMTIGSASAPAPSKA